MEFVIRTTVLFVIIGLANTLPSHKGESEKCLDDNQFCGEWASFGFCEDDAHTGYMLVFCKKSCGVCGSGGDVSEHTTKTSSTVSSSPVTTVTPSPVTDLETLPDDSEFPSNQTDMFRRSGAESIDHIIEDAMHETDPNAEDDQEPGVVTVELDMIFPEDEYLEMIDDNEKAAQEEKDGSAPDNNDKKKRKALNYQHMRWIDNIVYYKYGGGFSSKDKNIIKSAMDHWSKYTCIDFQRATSGTENYIEFKDGDGCSSWIGMTKGMQPVKLGDGCIYHGTVVHELGHAIGFFHEQSRPDRDDYITIKTENVRPLLIRNFNKHSAQEIDTQNVPYDYRSIMHYSGNAFSSNQKLTIITKDPKYQDIIGTATGLSFYDIKLANVMYSCNAHCPSKTCPGEGFVGKDCKCWCKGTTDDTNNPVVECDGGKTTGTSSITSVIPSSGNCVDDSQRCVSWASQGYCYMQYVQSKCKKSCELCGTS